MKASLFLAGIVPAALLIGCASVGGRLSPILTATHDFTVAEDGFDGAINSADVAINTGALPAMTVAKIHAIGDSGYVYVKAGRAAIVAGNATSVEQEAAALTALIPQIAALIPAKK